jgi:hypothetical protein
MLQIQKWFLQKNQEVYFLPLKCKTTPLPAKLAGTCANFRIYLQRLLQQNESWYAYPRWSTINVGCCSHLLILRFGSCFTKKTLFWHSENGKSTFCETKQESTFVAFLEIPRATRVSDMASFRQTMTCSWPNLAHLTKNSCNLERDRSFIWRDFLVNSFSQGLNFFPLLGHIKWRHAKATHFFWFF